MIVEYCLLVVRMGAEQSVKQAEAIIPTLPTAIKSQDAGKSSRGGVCPADNTKKMAAGSVKPPGDDE